MLSIDSTTLAFGIIFQCAPERQESLRAFWERYSIQFELVEDRAGIVLNADKDRVQYACKDLQVLWLLGFSLWRSIELLGPAILLPTLTGTTSASVLACDNLLDQIERDYRERLAAVATLIGASEMDPAKWPPDSPQPVACRSELSDPEDVAVYDLVMMATAVLFLHELKHVEFHAQHRRGSARPGRPDEEELQCDVWARDWFMSHIAAYAREHDHDFREVSSKRAIALLYVCEYLRLAHQHAGNFASADYPPLAARIAALSGGINLPADDKFWIFSACILWAEARRQGRKNAPESSDISPKDITMRLIDLLTS
jgi:hypothetical protein